MPPADGSTPSPNFAFLEHTCLTLAVLLLLSAQTSIAFAQCAQKTNHPDNNVVPFWDPQGFLEQFFHADASECREEIENVSVSPGEDQKLGSRPV